MATSITLDGTTYSIKGNLYTPGVNRLFDTRRSITGALDRTDSAIIERPYAFTLECTLAQKASLETSFAKTGTLSFTDPSAVTTQVYFMRPLAWKPEAPVGMSTANRFAVDVQLMVNAST